MTAARLLHAAASSPAPEGAIAAVAPCWWCGLASPGRGVPVPHAIPDTFPDRARAAVPESVVVCAPCAWTLSDRIALPAELADAGLARKLEAGGRLRVSVRGDDPGRPRLFLRLSDGRIGVWLVGKNAAADEPWIAARAVLRDSAEGAADIITDADLSVGATSRFRNYHHIGTPGMWRPCTAADRVVLRAFLLAPPTAAPWVVVIGDGQKHAALHASDAVVQPGDLHAAYVEGAIARWRPGMLAAWLGAVEGLRVAGASDEEIASGRYGRAGLAFVLARRTHEPTIATARVRQGCLDLALFIARRSKEISDGV